VSKNFRLTPAELVFDSEQDNLKRAKTIFIESTSAEQMNAEAIPSNHELISAIKSCGIVKPFGVVEIKVTVKLEALQQRLKEPMHVSVRIGNAKHDVPVKVVN
jgi:hypothetical protein